MRPNGRPARLPRRLAGQIDDLGARRQGNDRFRREIIHRVGDIGGVVAFYHRDAGIVQLRD